MRASLIFNHAFSSWHICIIVYVRQLFPFAILYLNGLIELTLNHVLCHQDDRWYFQIVKMCPNCSPIPWGKDLYTTTFFWNLWATCGAYEPTKFKILGLVQENVSSENGNERTFCFHFQFLWKQVWYVICEKENCPSQWKLCKHVWFCYFTIEMNLRNYNVHIYPMIWYVLINKLPNYI